MAILANGKFSLFRIDPGLKARGAIPLREAKISRVTGSVPGDEIKLE